MPVAPNGTKQNLLDAVLFRNIHRCGLIQEYKDTNGEIGRWSHYVSGLPFANPNKVGDCFAFDLNFLISYLKTILTKIPT